MQYEVSPDGQNNIFSLTFDKGEVPVLRAAYREWIAQLAGNPETRDNLSDFDATVADWGDGALVVSTPDPERIARVLKTFRKNTSVAIQEIIKSPGLPAYQNNAIAHIPLRVRLGSEALALANKIREEHGVHVLNQEMQTQWFLSDEEPTD